MAKFPADFARVDRAKDGMIQLWIEEIPGFEMKAGETVKDALRRTSAEFRAEASGPHGTDHNDRRWGRRLSELASDADAIAHLEALVTKAK